MRQRSRQVFSVGITAVLALSAVTMTALVLRGLLATPAARAAGSPPTTVTPQPAPNARALAAAGHREGPASARITLVEFSDFQCPYCAALQGTLAQLRARHRSDLAIVYRHYPLPAHRFAESAAVASECAARQGRFADYAAVLYRMQDSLGVTGFGELARRAGVADLDAFARCLRSPSALAQVSRDMLAGQRMGITATPTLFIQDEMVAGAPTLEQLEAWVRAAER